MFGFNRTFLFFLVLGLSSCVFEEDSTSITLRDPATNEIITFTSAHVTSIANQITWYSSNPATTSSGYFQILILETDASNVKTITFNVRPVFSEVNEANYSCTFFAVVNNCMGGLSQSSSQRVVTFRNIEIPLLSDSSGINNPVSYVINGTLSY